MLEFPGYSRCMRRGWKWLAVLAGIVTLLVTVVLPNWPDWQVVAGFAVLAGCLGAIAVLIYRDSAERGRSGWGWLAACVLAAPVAFPVFAFVAVFDRLRGRRGIESRWAPAGRWYLLAAVALGIAAVVLAASPVKVTAMSVSAPGASGSFDGSCSSALAVSLGGGTYGSWPHWPADASPVLATARATETERCSAAAAKRMIASAVCLAGVLLLALVGQGMNRRRDHRQQSLVLP